MLAEDLERQEVLERVMGLAAWGVAVEELAYALLARAGGEAQGEFARGIRGA